MASLRLRKLCDTGLSARVMFLRQLEIDSVRVLPDDDAAPSFRSRQARVCARQEMIRFDH
jgi:hypothetical protein